MIILARRLTCRAFCLTTTMYLRSPNVTIHEVWPEIFVVEGVVLQTYPVLRQHCLVAHEGKTIRIIPYSLTPDDILGLLRSKPAVVALHP